MNALLKLRIYVLIASMATIAYSCKEADDGKENLSAIEFDEKSISIEVDEEFQLSLQAVPLEAAIPKCVFFSDDDKIATISATGLVTGVAAGTTTVNAKTSDGEYFASCEVTVTSADLYREPYLTFGCSVADIKKYETRELQEEISTRLTYYGENDDVYYVRYILTAGIMDYVGVVFQKTAKIEEKVLDFLLERYEYVEEEDDVLYFVDSDWKIVAAVVVLDGGYLSVLYLDNTPAESPALRSSNWKSAVKEASGQFNAFKHETE
jgi:hypothetical protein